MNYKKFILFVISVFIIIVLIEFVGIVTKNKIIIGDENYFLIFIGLVGYSLIFLTFKNLKLYWVRGTLIGAIIPFILFSFFLHKSALYYLPQLIKVYKESQFCQNCETNGTLLLECAIKICNRRSNSDCRISLERDIRDIIEINKIKEEIDIAKTREVSEKRFTARQCEYDLALTGPLYETKPTFLTAFFDEQSRVRALNSFGYLWTWLVHIPLINLLVFNFSFVLVPILILISITLPIFIGAYIGWKIEKRKI